MRAQPNGDYLPPPSTLAAQLVRDHAGTSKKSTITDVSATFGQLLQEILNNAEIPETKPEVNYKLIRVVTEAGLDVLAQDNPFAQWDVLLPQARDSLLVIESTIRRQPELLFYGFAESVTNDANRPSLRLLLWLFPKLLCIASHPRCTILQPSISRLLGTVVDSLANSISLWQHAKVAVMMYFACLDDIYTALASLSSISNHEATLDIRLPPVRSISDMSYGSEPPTTVAPGFQHSVNSILGALQVANSLLLGLSGLVNEGPAFKVLPLGTHILASRSFDALDILGDVIFKLRQPLTKNDAFLRVLDTFTSVMRRFCCSDTPVLWLRLDKANHSAMRFVLTFLQVHLSMVFPPGLQERLAGAIRLLIDVPSQMMTEDHGADVMITKTLQRVYTDENNIWNQSNEALRSAIRDLVTHMNIQLSEEAKRQAGSFGENDSSDESMSGMATNGSLEKAGVHGGLALSKRSLRRSDRAQKASSSTSKQEIYNRLTGLLADRSSSDITGLAGVAEASYAALKDDHKDILWDTLSRCFCVIAGSLNDDLCDLCHSEVRKSAPLSNLSDQDSNDMKELGRLMSELLNTLDLQQSKQRRIVATLCVRSFILHCQLPDYLDLGKSSFGEWCLRALNSSNRELRMVASRALVAYLRHDIDRTIRDSNRQSALDYLRALSDRATLGQHDTLISAWGQVAVTCGESELNLALLRLVDFLGHPNALVCGLASTELEHIASSLNLTPQALFKPFWRSIAVTVVQDLHTNPQKCQLLADYLGTSVNQFLTNTQTETLPLLLLTKKRDTLQRLATARGPNVKLQDICTQPRKNLAVILALLLSQPSNDIETTAMDILAECVPSFKDQELANIVRIDPVPIVVEMLKSAGDEDANRKGRIINGIQTLAVLVERRPGQSKASAKQNKLLASFFETQILGIMTQFSDTIEKADESVPQNEKIRCLYAVKEMINLARTHISIAVPQIRACLQSAFDQPGLVDAAMSAWLAMMNTFEAEEVVNLLDHMFAVTVQHWSELTAELQKEVHDTVAHVLKTHSNLIRDSIITVPSLAGIQLMSKFEAEISRLKAAESSEVHLAAFGRRLQNENSSVVLQGARELYTWLQANQTFVHESAISEPPLPVLSTLLRSLLDVCVKYGSSSKNSSIASVSAQCLGLIGCLDPNHIEATATTKQTMVMSNFDKAAEVVDWVAVLFDSVLVPAFKSTNNARAQGFLAFVMQELLRFSGYNEVASVRLRASQSSPTYTRWIELPESTRNILTPFLTSRYALTSTVNVRPVKYPIFDRAISHSTWLKTWVYDMLWRARGENASSMFPTLARVIKGHDLAIANFLLPYAALNIILGGPQAEVDAVANEMLIVLSTESSIHSEQDAIRQCSQNIFAVLDYMSRWVQTKKQDMAALRAAAVRAGHSPKDFEEAADLGRIASVERVITSIPANIIAQRAIECGSYARALFHWEDFIRDQCSKPDTKVEARNAMYDRLQTIYSQIDEPDGLDGIAAQLNVLTPDQQAFQHRRAGRWSAAQSWYEIESMRRPNDSDIQLGLLSCLKESGQFNQVIRISSGNMVNNGNKSVKDTLLDTKLLSFMAEAGWMTENIGLLHKQLSWVPTDMSVPDFNVSVGRILITSATGHDEFKQQISKLRASIVKNMSAANVASLQACHSTLLDLHVLSEMESISHFSRGAKTAADSNQLASMLDKRLAILGSYISDKQYVLGIRRAMMMAVNSNKSTLEIGSLWLTTAKLARKSNVPAMANFAVLRAAQCGDDSSKIEQARLLWKDGQHRQAIHNLEGAIASNVFAAYDRRMEQNSNPEEAQAKQNALSARAHLLLAKWLDSSGQTQAHMVTSKYQYAARTFARWEKGHYYLGKHYNKLLEAEKALPTGKQSEAYTTGETTKLVIENYLRSVPFGTKYWFQTIPKVITLWLDLGMDCLQRPRDLNLEVFERRKKHLDLVHKQLKKYFDRVPPYIFYTSLPQMISRISHPNDKVSEVLSMIIQKIVSSHPSQALWSLLPVSRATQADRAKRGMEIIHRLKDAKSRTKSDSASLDLRTMVMQGQKLQEGLLQACEIHIEGRATNVSLSRDLQFSHKLAPSTLVVPFQFALTPNVPTVQDATHIRHFKGFASDKVTIASFADEVLVLSSLQRPRKLTVRGSDGKSYGLLCKPKDDLRKDQRLMEFNTMINRSLKRDAESSKRRLYIKTYGVTPLSEESGTIEWVEGIKPLRDILIKLYNRKGIHPNYTELRNLLGEACAESKNVVIFTDKIMPTFPPILHEWFVEIFPEPDTWFAARLRYARSAAVMSIVGHVLGLGDRHGENILLEESTGGVFHVDFNCLFDKGLTFEKPELVPFRLTHNMVDAMGCYGVEGPFRKSSELTLQLLRQHMDTLMNILETFVHDPTTDFIGKKKRTTHGVPETPQEVLDSVLSKLKGYLRGESVPLSVEGHVDALIKQATDPWNLCRMYIGWCSFL